jgi:hypothetical protein
MGGPLRNFFRRGGTPCLFLREGTPSPPLPDFFMVGGSPPNPPTQKCVTYIFPHWPMQDFAWSYHRSILGAPVSRNELGDWIRAVEEGVVPPTSPPMRVGGVGPLRIFLRGGVGVPPPCMGWNRRRKIGSVENLFHKIWLTPLRQPCPRRGRGRMRCLDNTCHETSRIFLNR